MSGKTFVAISAALVLGAGLYFYGGHTVPPTQPPLVALTLQNLPTIERAFNEAKGDVRVLVLLSPT